MKIGEVCISIKKQIKAIRKTFGFVKYTAILTGALVVSVMVAAGVATKDMKTVTISYDGELYEITTRADDVAGALKDAGIILSADDKVNYELGYGIDNINGMIEVEKPITLTVNMAGNETIIKTYTNDASSALEENNINIEGNYFIEGTDNGTVSDGDEINVVIVSTKTITEEEELPFDVEYVDDATLYKGEKEVVSEGSNGYVKRTYTVTYEDGVEVSRDLVMKETVDPTNKVVAVGTKSYFTTSRGFNENYSACYKMEATAYAPTPENHGYATASGNRARVGVVAVDRNVIPLGTKLYVKCGSGNDYGYAIAWDTGGSIKNMRIDLFMESNSECNKFGRRDVTVYVLEDQSVDIFALRG